MKLSIPYLFKLLDSKNRSTVYDIHISGGQPFDHRGPKKSYDCCRGAHSQHNAKVHIIFIHINNFSSGRLGAAQKLLAGRMQPLSINPCRLLHSL